MAALVFTWDYARGERKQTRIFTNKNEEKRKRIEITLESCLFFPFGMEFVMSITDRHRKSVFMSSKVPWTMVHCHHASLPDVRQSNINSNENEEQKNRSMTAIALRQCHNSEKNVSQNEQIKWWEDEKEIALKWRRPQDETERKREREKLKMQFKSRPTFALNVVRG